MSGKVDQHFSEYILFYLKLKYGYFKQNMTNKNNFSQWLNYGKNNY